MWGECLGQTQLPTTRFFGRHGRMVEDVSGGRGDSHGGSIRRMDGFSQRGYSVRGDGCDGCVGESCGKDVS